jgi:hypothetical protein
LQDPVTAWYVSRRGKIRGPFTESEVFELIGKRRIALGDLVDVDQSGNWWPVERVPTFAASFMASGPMPYVPQIIHQLLPDVCRNCGMHGGVIVKSRVTTGGWFVFWIFLLPCFLLSLVGLIAMRDQYRVCSSCGASR